MEYSDLSIYYFSNPERSIDQYITWYRKFLLQAYLSSSTYEEEKKGEIRVFPSSVQ